jgi:hypothetical protein
MIVFHTMQANVEAYVFLLGASSIAFVGYGIAKLADERAQSNTGDSQSLNPMLV